MSRIAWTAGACVATAALAYWLGARGASAPASPTVAQPPAATARVAAPPVRHEVAPAGGLTVDDVRAVVREELAARDDDAAPAAAEATEAERETAVTTAHTAIADGISDGVWDERDRVTLGIQVARLGPDDAAKAIAPLFAAINAQRVELRGPPL
jgi:hypothetical protein